MIEFEKIGDTFEDGFEKVKDFTQKNKVLTIAICGIGAFALYKLYSDKTATAEDTGYVSTYAYVPTAYDGYPTMSESVSYNDVVEQVRSETTDINDDFYNETMSDVTHIVEDMIYENERHYENIVTSMNDYRDELVTMSYLQEQQEQQNIIDRMYSNSQAWGYASDSEKERLHEENVILGAIIGAVYDSASGTWSKDGESLYSSVNKNSTNYNTSNLVNVGGSDSSASRSDIISQMKANSQAWGSSSSEAEKQKLYEENQRLGKSIGGVYNSASGTWSNSDGTPLYSVSSSGSGSKSPSSGSGSKSTSSGSSGNGTTVTSVTKNADGTYTHKWSNGKTTVQTQKNGGIVLSRK